MFPRITRKISREGGGYTYSSWLMRLPLKAFFFRAAAPKHNDLSFFWRKVQILRQQGDDIFLSSVRNPTKKSKVIHHSYCFCCPNLMFWTVGQPGKFQQFRGFRLKTSTKFLVAKLNCHQLIFFVWPPWNASKAARSTLCTPHNLHNANLSFNKSCPMPARPPFEICIYIYIWCTANTTHHLQMLKVSMCHENL